MKKTILTLLLLVFAMAMTRAQSVNFTVPSSVCFNQQTGQAYTQAILTQTAGASSYSWGVTSNGTCNATTSPNSNGSGIFITFNCCGLYTVTVYPSTGPSVSHTVNAVCPAPLVIAPTPSFVCAGDSVILVASGASSYTWNAYGWPAPVVGNSITVPPSSSTCYTVTGSYSGCTSTAVRCVPVASSSPGISGPNSVCAGGTVALSAAGYSLSWQPGGQFGNSIIVSPSVTTCYTVTGISACNGFFSAVKCVTVQPSGTINVFGQDSICAGSTTTLTASGAANYTWQPGNLTGSSIVISPTVNTCYTVTGSGGGCGISTGVKCVRIIYNNGGTIPVYGPNSICLGGTVALSATGYSLSWQPGNLYGSSIVVSPTVTTCYTVTGLNTCGGFASSVKCVSVQPAGTISVFGLDSVCIGQTTTLTASGAANYTWQPGNLTGSSIVISPTISTCYTVTGSGGICGTAMGIKCVSIRYGSGSINIFGPNSVCPGSTLALTATGASNYTWQPGNIVGPNAYFFPFSSTCYTVTGQNTCNGALVSAIKCVSVGNGTIAINGPNTICAGDSITLVASGGTSYTWQPGNVQGPIYHATAGFSTTCYTVTASGNCGNGSAVYCITPVIPGGAVSVSGPNSICAGSSATLSAMGGASYTWQPGGFTGPGIVVTPSASTCYTVTGQNLCGGGTFFVVKCLTVTPTGTITINGPNTICAGTSATLTAVGGPSTYVWQPGGFIGTSIVVTPAISTCYTVTGIGSCGGTVTVVKCITVQPSGNGITVTGPNSICAGSGAVLTASGGSSYTWQPGALTGPSVVVTPSVSTCYTVTGQNLCGGGTSSVVHCIMVTPTGTITVNGPNVICAGTSATLTAVGGPSTYIWQPGGIISTSLVVTPSVTTCYTVTGIGSCGGGTVTVVKCITVQPSGSGITVTGLNSICAGNSAMLTAAGGSSYTWQPGSFTGPTVVVSPSVSTCYTVTGINLCGGGISSAVHCVSVSPNGTLSISGPNFVCPGNSALLIASGSTGGYTWQPSGVTSPSIVVTPSVFTCYTVTGVTCAGLTTITKCVSIYPGNVVVSGPNAVCAGNSATLTASNGTSYTWQPGNLTGSSIVVTPSINTCYTVTTSGSNSICPGTVAPGVFCVAVNPLPNVTASMSTNFLCAGQSATLSASGATTYVWQPFNLTGSSIVITPTVSTCYTVIGTSSVGCSSAAYGCFSVVPNPTISVISPGNAICAGSSATLSASGAGSYTWSNGATSASIVVSPSITTCYSVAGSYFGGCVGTAIRCVTVQSSNIIINGPNSICAGNTATLTASGSSNYTWQPGGFAGLSIVVSPSISTCYTVTGSGGSCGSGSAVKCITVQAPPVVAVSGNSVACQGSPVGLSASGAATYTWLPGNLTGSFVSVTPSVTTCYTVVGTAANGCIGIGVRCISIGTVSTPVISITGNTFVCAGSSATLTASGAGSYTWSNGSNAPSIVVSPTATTCYTVVGSNSGCSGVSAAATCVQVSAAPVVNISGSNVICGGGTVTLTASGASSYTWNNGSTGSSIVVSPSVSTCYTVVGSNPGCTNVGVAVKCIQVTSQPVITITGNSLVCAGSTLTLTANGATSYTWSNGATGSSIVLTPTAPACYTVAGSTGAGCNGSAVKCFSVVTSISMGLTPNQTICQGDMVSLIASGASTYSWSNGSTSNAIFVSPAVSTIYTVTGNIGNCSQTRTVAVFVNPRPVITLASNAYVICAGQTATLTGSGALTYTWQPGGLSGSPVVVSPSVTTQYTVTGTNSFGCASTMTLVLGVSPCTGIDAAKQHDAGIFVYPNPASSFITLQAEVTGTVNYFVCDMIGREIINGSFTGKKDLDLSAYANGTYIIRFESASGTMYKKLVIEK